MIQANDLADEMTLVAEEAAGLAAVIRERGNLCPALLADGMLAAISTRKRLSRLARKVTARPKKPPDNGEVTAPAGK